MKVVIECVMCGGATEVHIHGLWDIDDVLHNCPRQLGSPTRRDGRDIKEREFYVIFDPPRRPF